MPPVLIIGYGNPLRSDDAVGWLAAQELQRVYADDPERVEVRACHQLNPELVEELAAAKFVVFIDASVDGTAGEVRYRPVRPAHFSGLFSHQLEPADLLAAAVDLFGTCPEAAMLAVAGESFGAGTSLSRTVNQALPKVVEQARRKVDAYLQTAAS